MRAEIFAKINNAVHTAVEVAIALLTLCMVIIVACNVFARYCLKIGFIWAEELSLTMFVWVVFLGAYYALSKKAHLALNFLVKRLPKKFRIADKYIVLGLVAVFLFALTIGGMEFVSSTIKLKQVTPLLGISAAWKYACIPVSSVLMLFEVIVILIKKEAVVDLKDIGLYKTEA